MFPTTSHPIFVVKKDIHPKSHPAVYIDVSTNRRFTTNSTASSKKRETINGVEHMIFLRDVTGDSHPAYTGEKRFVDTAGRVDKFNKKFGDLNFSMTAASKPAAELADSIVLEVPDTAVPAAE